MLPRHWALPLPTFLLRHEARVLWRAGCAACMALLPATRGPTTGTCLWPQLLRKPLGGPCSALRASLSGLGTGSSTRSEP